MDVNVAMDRLTEPFNFTTIQMDKRTERWRVDDGMWEKMIAEAKRCNVKTEDVDRRPRPRQTRPRGAGRGRGKGRGRGRGRR